MPGGNSGKGVGTYCNKMADMTVVFWMLDYGSLSHCSSVTHTLNISEHKNMI
jgi:hypothetical protein